MERLPGIEHMENRLGLKRPQCWKLIRDEIITPPVIVRVGRQIRVNPAELEKWIEAGGASFEGGWRKETTQAER